MMMMMMMVVTTTTMMMMTAVAVAVAVAVVVVLLLLRRCRHKPQTEAQTRKGIKSPSHAPQEPTRKMLGSKLAKDTPALQTPSRNPRGTSLSRLMAAEW